MDPGEVFQDAAGEGEDQVDVDVGVVFNASVIKGKQTLVYASPTQKVYVHADSSLSDAAKVDHWPLVSSTSACSDCCMSKALCGHMLSGVRSKFLAAC